MLITTTLTVTYEGHDFVVTGTVEEMIGGSDDLGRKEILYDVELDEVLYKGVDVHELLLDLDRITGIENAFEDAIKQQKDEGFY